MDLISMLLGILIGAIFTPFWSMLFVLVKGKVVSWIEAHLPNK